MVFNQAQPSGMNRNSGSTVDRATPDDTLKGATGAKGKADDGIRQDRLLGLLKGEPPRFRVARETPPEAEMLTKQQAASLLTVSVRTLDRLVSRGDIPHVVIGRRCVRFPQKALKSWIELKTKFRK